MKLPAYRMSRLRALGHAMDFRETFRELWIGSVYLWEKMCGHDPKPDINARRVAHYKNAFGLTRPPGTVMKEPNEKVDPLHFPIIRVEKEYYDDTRGRQWLGHGNDYGYGIYREKSDDLEVQIERELERRGYGSRTFHLLFSRLFLITSTENPCGGHTKPPSDVEDIGHSHQPRRSWWQSIYNRISQSGTEDNGVDHTVVHSRHASRRKSKSRDPSKLRSQNPSPDVDIDYVAVTESRYDMDDLPPPSLFRSKLSSGKSKAERGAYSSVTPYGDEDMLAPLSSFNGYQKFYKRQSQYRNSEHRQGPKIMFSPSTADYPPRSSPPPASPPPQSLLAPVMMMSHGDASADSLLGRVFPSKSSDANLTVRGTDNTHSTGHVRVAPRTALPSRESVHDIGEAGERHPVHSQASLPPNIPQAMSAYVLNPMRGANSKGNRYTEYRLHDNVEYEPNNIPTFQFSSPTRLARLSSQPSHPRPAPNPKPRNEYSPGLRRSSAQVGRKQAQARRSAGMSLHPRTKHHSLPAVLTIPRPLATPSANAYSDDHMAGPSFAQSYQFLGSYHAP